MTVVIEDGFSGTNGDNITGRTPDTIDNGNTWNDFQQLGAGAGESEVQSNEMAFGQNGRGVSIEGADADGTIQFEWYTPSGSNNRNSMIFRLSDNYNYNYLNIRHDQGTNDDWQLVNVVASGFDTELSNSYVWTDNAWHTIKLNCDGDTINAWIDENQIITDRTMAENNTNTSHGVYRNASDGVARTDDFTFDDTGAPPVGGIASQRTLIGVGI